MPNITFGQCVIKSIRKCTKAVFDVHLMISDPMKYIEMFANAGADLITIHLEAGSQKPEEIIKKIKSYGKKAGISIKPGTSVESVMPYIHLLDLVLVMSVEPGFGGQKYIPGSENKIEILNKYIKSKNLNCIIEVDGGIDESNIPLVVSSGAQLLVCGNSVFGAKTPKQTYQKLQKVIESVSVQF